MKSLKTLAACAVLGFAVLAETGCLHIPRRQSPFKGNPVRLEKICNDDERILFLEDIAQRIERKDSRETAKSAMKVLSPVVRRMNKKQFCHYRDLVEEAHNELNISYAHRYSIKTLEQALDNWNSPTLSPDKDIALTFMNQSDKRDMFSWYSCRLEDFVKGYHLLVFEVNTREQIRKRLSKIREKFPNNKIAGLIIGGHGSSGYIALGKNDTSYIGILPRKVDPIFSEYIDMFKDNPIIALPNCLNGRKTKSGYPNIAQSFPWTFSEKHPQISACSDRCTGFKYKLNEDGTVVPESIRFFGRLFDKTVIINSSPETYEKEAEDRGIDKERLAKFNHRNIRNLGVIEAAIQLGLTAKDVSGAAGSVDLISLNEESPNFFEYKGSLELIKLLGGLFYAKNADKYTAFLEQEGSSEFMKLGGGKFREYRMDKYTEFLKQEGAMEFAGILGDKFKILWIHNYIEFLKQDGALEFARKLGRNFKHYKMRSYPLMPIQVVVPQKK